MLTPARVTIFNESHAQNIDGGLDLEQEIAGIDRAKLPADILAEAAFNVAWVAVKNGFSALVATKDAAIRIQSWSVAVEKISRFRDVGLFHECPDPQSPIGTFFDRLSARFDPFLNRGARDGIEFLPKLPGLGFLRDVEADISIGQTLFEVKAVHRNFTSHDVRQLLIYLALDHLRGESRWARGGFFNPRRNRVLEFDPTVFLPSASAGKSAVEVYQELGDFLMDRGIEIDTPF